MARYRGLRLTLSDHTTPYPPMPLEWWRQWQEVPYPYQQPYQPVPNYANWFPIKDDEPEPTRGDEDMRC